MSGLVKKLKSFIDLGFMSGYEEDEEEMFEELQRAGEKEYTTQDNLALEPVSRSREKANLKVVRHPNFNGYEVKVVEPRSFEDSLEIVNSLIEKRSVILNLHLLDNEQSQRIVDFISGATHAVNGHQQKIGEGVFIFTPCNVAISYESEKARAITDAFWNRPQ